MFITLKVYISSTWLLNPVHKLFTIFLFSLDWGLWYKLKLHLGTNRKLFSRAFQWYRVCLCYLIVFVIKFGLECLKLPAFLKFSLFSFLWINGKSEINLTPISSSHHSPRRGPVSGDVLGLFKKHISLWMIHKVLTPGLTLLDDIWSNEIDKICNKIILLLK